MSVVQFIDVRTWNAIVTHSISYACLGWKDLTRLTHIYQQCNKYRLWAKKRV